MGAVGRVLDGEIQRLGDPGGERATGLRGVELQGAADQMRRVEVTQDDVGVRDGRHLAADVVADGARHGPGTLRSHLQGAAGIDPDVRAAAGPDLRQVDGGDLERVTGPR